MLLQYNIAFYIPNQGPRVSLDYTMQKGAKWNTNVPKLWKEGDITIPPLLLLVTAYTPVREYYRLAAWGLCSFMSEAFQW